MSDPRVHGPGRTLALIAMVLLAAPAARSDVSAESATDRLGALFDGLHERGVFDGSVLVAEDGEIVYEACFGAADDATGEPITPRTRFRLASVSKPITATAVLILAERGDLGLDDPVSRHLPRFPHGDVTIRQLLTHTSGLPGHHALFARYGDALPDGVVVTNDRVLDVYRDAAPEMAAPPGVRVDYNNLNYIVLAEIIERASGRPFARVLREEIFEPAGMRDTDVCTTVHTEGPPPRLATGYVQGSGKDEWTPEAEASEWEFVVTFSGTAGDGGIISTPRDLLRFDRALRDGTLLSDSSLDSAYRPGRLADGSESWQDDWMTSSYGLGWRIRKDRDSVFHTGDWGGFLTMLHRSLDRDRVVVYLKNRRSTDWSWLEALDAIVASPAPLRDGSVPEPYVEQILGGEEAQADVDLLRRAVRELHAGYGRYTSPAATDALLDDLERAVADGSTDLELYRRVSAMLPALRCDHTMAELPPAIEAHRMRTPSYLPFTFRIVHGRLHVDVARAGTGLRRGDEILSINGRPTGAVLEDVARFVPVDGWTDHVRPVAMASSSEFLGGAVDHFWPMIEEWPRSWTIGVRRLGEATVREVRAAPITYPQWLELDAGEEGRWRNFADAVEFRMLDERTGYLSIGTFVNYRSPVDPASILDPVFDRLREVGAEHLVLDLRRCGGGSTDVPDALMTYLLDVVPERAARRPWVRAVGVGDLRPHLSTWDETIFDAPPELFHDLGNGHHELRLPGGNVSNDPRPNRFTGPLTVLIGPANSSGATALIALLDAHHPALRTVGQATGGSAEGPTAGILVYLTLPHSGIRVRIPLIRSWINVPDPPPGRGVDPDVPVSPTVADWLEGRDTVLERARSR